jgi:AP-2 complex subunit alpha
LTTLSFEHERSTNWTSCGGQNSSATIADYERVACRLQRLSNSPNEFQVRVSCGSNLSNFSSNGRAILLNLRLPILIAKFTEPFLMNGPDFFSNWKQIGETPPLCEQMVVKSPRPIDMTWLQKLVNVGCRFAVLQGVDPNVNNLVAAGNVTTSSSTVPCFVRMETNAAAAMYRITVKSSNALITAGVKDLLATQLG